MYRRLSSGCSWEASCALSSYCDPAACPWAACMHAHHGHQTKLKRPLQPLRIHKVMRVTSTSWLHLFTPLHLLCLTPARDRFSDALPPLCMMSASMSMLLGKMQAMPSLADYISTDVSQRHNDIRRPQQGAVTPLGCAFRDAFRGI